MINSYVELDLDGLGGLVDVKDDTVFGKAQKKLLPHKFYRLVDVYRIYNRSKYIYIYYIYIHIRIYIYTLVYIIYAYIINAYGTMTLTLSLQFVTGNLQGQKKQQSLHTVDPTSPPLNSTQKPPGGLLHKELRKKEAFYYCP